MLTGTRRRMSPGPRLKTRCTGSLMPSQREVPIYLYPTELIRCRAIPSSSSDAGSTYLSHSSPRASPSIEASGFATPGESAFANSLIYDDPRSVHESGGSNPGSLPKYSARNLTGDGYGSRTPRTDGKRDQGVRVNLMAPAAQGKRGWGMSNLVTRSRLTGMVKGPDGKYAVGGGQCE